MAIISRPTPDAHYSNGQTAVGTEVKADLDTIYADHNGNIQNANIATNAAIIDAKLATISTAGKVSGAALTSLSSIPSGAGIIPTANLPATSIATQAEMEAASSLVVLVSPGRVQYHPGVAKAWCNFNGTGTPAMNSNYNMDASITDNGVGDYTVSFTTDFSSANFAAVGMVRGNVFDYLSVAIDNTVAMAAGTLRIFCTRTDSGIPDDANPACLVVFGDQ